MSTGVSKVRIAADSKACECLSVWNFAEVEFILGGDLAFVPVPESCVAGKIKCVVDVPDHLYESLVGVKVEVALVVDYCLETKS